MLAADCPAQAPSAPLPPEVRRDDPWSLQVHAGHTIEFTLRADAEADTLSRVLGFFAQLSLVPQRMEVRRDGDDLRLALRQDGLTPHRAEVMAQKMRALVCVAEVDWKPA